VQSQRVLNEAEPSASQCRFSWRSWEALSFLWDLQTCSTHGPHPAQMGSQGQTAFQPLLQPLTGHLQERPSYGEGLTLGLFTWNAVGWMGIFHGTSSTSWGRTLSALREDRGLGQDLHDVMALGALLVVVEHPTLLESSQSA